MFGLYWLTNNSKSLKISKQLDFFKYRKIMKFGITWDITSDIVHHFGDKPTCEFRRFSIPGFLCYHARSENTTSTLFNTFFKEFPSTNLYGSLWFVVRPGVCGDQGFDTHLTYVVRFVWPFRVMLYMFQLCVAISPKNLPVWNIHQSNAW